MTPQTHRQESLQRAYITAIAAYAGIKLEPKHGVEYGIDGTFRLVTELKSRHGKKYLSETGFPLDFQLKSTVKWRYLQNGTDVSYDCEIDAYNKMVLQNAEKGTAPVVLLVLCLPKNEDDWVSITEDALIMRKACYWYYVKGKESDNHTEQVIRIPRSQLFTPESLAGIMITIQKNQGEL